METFIAFGLIAFLAFANGSNDNFKGMAPSYSSGIIGYKTAVVIATIATIAGGITALFIAQKLIVSFSGKGLVPEEVIQSTKFIISVAGAASVTVMLASFIGFPISTTHAILGGVIGAGLLASRLNIRSDVLIYSFILPLILSPLLAGGSCFLLSDFFNDRQQFRKKKVIVGTSSKVFDQSEIAEWRTMQLVSGSAICFARALNDTPKILGLSAFLNIPQNMGYFAIISAMAIGGIISAKKVAETISKKISSVDKSDVLLTNTVVGALVLSASELGLPVSTTQVAVGAMMGNGIVNSTANWQTLKMILMSWLLTLPLSTIVSATIYYLMPK